MRTLLLKGFSFLGVAIILYAAAFFVLCHVRVFGRPVIYRTSDYYHWKGGVAFEKFKEYDPHQHWDAVIIGSSHAYRGYDPRVFTERGYRVFNLGTSGQTPLSSLVMLKHYVDPATTRLVIFDLFENTVDQQGLESVSDLIENFSSDAAALDLATSLKDVRLLNMLTLRWNTNGDTALSTDTTYVGEGFAVRTDSLRKKVTYDHRPFRLKEDQLENLQRCVAWCAEHNVPIVLASHFYPHQSDPRRHAAYRHVLDSVFAHGPQYIDLSYGHALSDTDHFADQNHLNAAGARIFTGQLIDSLESEGYLRARR